MVGAGIHPMTMGSGFASAAGQFPASITVSGTTTTADGEHVLQGGLEQGKRWWYLAAFDALIQWDNGAWIVARTVPGPETWTHLTGDGDTPPKTDWPVGSSGSPAPTLSY